MINKIVFVAAIIITMLPFPVIAKPTAKDNWFIPVESVA
jgi:heme/copper-type cytochrome/quinol oxidase subunit 4